MKRIVLLLSAVLAVIFLASCSNNEVDLTDFKQDITVIYVGLETSTTVVSDVTLTTRYKDTFDVVWTSNHEAIKISGNKGLVSRNEEKDQNVTLTASLKVKDKEVKKTFELIVLKKEIELLETYFLVSYDLGYENSPPIDHVSVLEGTVLKDELVTLNRPGYVFLGWYLYDMKYTDIQIFEDVTLLARWGEETTLKTTYVEDFQNVVSYREHSSEYPKSQYLSGPHESNGILFDYCYFRTDIGLSESAPKAVTIKGTGDGTSAGRGWVSGLNIKDGISYLEFDARLPFSPNSSYPQGPGNDKAINVYITLIIEQDGKVVYTSRDHQRPRQFENDKEANKGKKFVFEDIDVKGVFNITIEVSSGHIATIANLLWQDNKGLSNNEKTLIQKIDFNDLQIDAYNTTDEIISLNGHDYVVKEMWSNHKNIHGEKELPFLSEANGVGIARLRGNSTKIDSTPLAYIYNHTYFDRLTSISFVARLFGTNDYPGIGKINVYYQISGSDQWVLLAFDNELSLDFKTFTIDLDKENVRIKIEASEGTVNIDNIEFFK